MSFRKRLRKIIDRRMRRLVFRVFGDEIHPNDYLLNQQSTEGILIHLKRNNQHVNISRARLVQRLIAQQQLLEERSALLTELAQALEHQTVTDVLTDMCNPKGMRERFKIEANLLGHATASSPISMLFMDLDRFKWINDKFGHDVGDSAILAFVQAMKKEFRESDILCRLHGDEFLVIMLNTPPDEAKKKAEDFLSSLKQVVLPVVLPKEFRLSASIGVASITLSSNKETEQQLEELIRLTDIAMYYAKRQGRNRVVLYESGMVMEN